RQFQNEGIRTATVDLIEARHAHMVVIVRIAVREGSLRGVRPASDIRRASGIDRNVEGKIGAVAAQIGRVVQALAVWRESYRPPADAAVEGVVEASRLDLVVVVRVAVWEGRLGGLGGPNNVGPAINVDPNLLADVSTGAADIGSVDQALAPWRELDDE